jgi:erythromycin esterase-like protein
VLWSFIALILSLAAGGCVGRQQQHKADWVRVAYRKAFPLSQLAERVRDSRIVILGETHALVEPIETLRLLLSETNWTGWTHVAFEWAISDQADLDRYMAGDDTVLQRFRKLYGQLPGATTEYLDTFSFIREGNRAQPNRALQVCVVDVPHPVRNVAEEERDLHMFHRIGALVEANPGSRIPIHCGDGHAAKCGLLEYATRAGGKESKPTLGARLCRRYPGKVVSIDVVSRYDPMWWQIKNESPFQSPVVSPVSNRWPDASSLGLPLWGLPHWHPDSADRPVTAKAVFDYVVWWPTSRAGTRGQ